jgi:SAM-dependent methyltransferase
MPGPTPSFWQERFESGQIPWDRRGPSPQLAAWLAAGVLRPGMSVVVPGCGSGHEVAVLAAAGCAVTGLDYAPAAVAATRKRLGDENLKADVLVANVLEWHPQAPCDAIYEQTCLCALHPEDWISYADRLHAWLRPGGTLCALFMQVRRQTADQGIVEGPPYHCDINAMRALFPAARWQWPKPPYPAVPHPQGWFELAVTLERRP